MRPIVVPFIAAALLLPAFAGDKKSKDPEGYAWEANFEAAKVKAAADGKLLFLDFWFEG